MWFELQPTAVVARDHPLEEVDSEKGREKEREREKRERVDIMVAFP